MLKAKGPFSKGPIGGVGFDFLFSKVIITQEIEIEDWLKAGGSHANFGGPRIAS